MALAFSSYHKSTNNHINLNSNERSYGSMFIHKKQILIENKGKCGIYLITNTLNGKRYVGWWGSAQDLGRRLRYYYSPNSMKHVLLKSRMLIYSSILKYTLTPFKLDIIEYCDSSVLHQRETYFIEKLNPEYNILRIGSSLIGFKHREISKIKMRIARAKRVVQSIVYRLGLCASRWESALNRKRERHTEETRAKIKSALLGRKLSETTIAKLKTKLKNRVWNKPGRRPEARVKMSEAKLGRKLNEETRTKISTGRKNNPIGTKVLVNNIKTGEILQYQTISDAAKAIEVSRITVKNYLISGKLLKSTYYIVGEKNEIIQNNVKPSAQKWAAFIPVVVTNITTGEEIEYSSINAASKVLNTNGHKIKRYIISGKCFENVYLIKYKQ